MSEEKRIIIRDGPFDINEIKNKLLAKSIVRLDIENIDFLEYCRDIRCLYTTLNRPIMIAFYLYDDKIISSNDVSERLDQLKEVDQLYVSNSFLAEKYALYKPKIIRVITFGTYDLFHHGHDRLFKRCKDHGEYLVVGVSSDILNLKKGKLSVNQLDKRIYDVKANQYVDEVFTEESLELKDDYVKYFGADLLIMGDDWLDKFDWVSCMTKYLTRTPGISSTLLKNQLLHKEPQY